METQKEKNTVVIYNAEVGSFNKKGWNWLGSNFVDVNVLITKGESIEFYGKRTYNGASFHKIFRIGDIAEYGSYNLIYTGEIVSIGEKTVTIVHYPDDPNSRKSMLRIDSFIGRNHDYDSEEIARKNADTMMVI